MEQIERIEEKLPKWFAACNGIAFFSPTGYFCNYGIIPDYVVDNRMLENRERLLEYIDRKKQEENEKLTVKELTVKDCCDALKLTEEFVIAILIEEFGEEFEELEE